MNKKISSAAFLSAFLFLTPVQAAKAPDWNTTVDWIETKVQPLAIKGKRTWNDGRALHVSTLRFDIVDCSIFLDVSSIKVSEAYGRKSRVEILENYEIPIVDINEFNHVRGKNLSELQGGQSSFKVRRQKEYVTSGIPDKDETEYVSWATFTFPNKSEANLSVRMNKAIANLKRLANKKGCGKPSEAF